MTKDFSGAIRLPGSDESIAPVTILDAQGKTVCVVSAVEFRQTHPRLDAPRDPGARRRRRGD